MQKGKRGHKRGQRWSCDIMKQVSLEERCSWHWVLTGKSVSGRGRQSSPGKGICVADKLSSTFYEAHTSDSGFLLGVYKKQDKAETRSKTHPFHSINPFLFHATHFSVFVEMFFFKCCIANLFCRFYTIHLYFHSI